MSENKGNETVRWFYDNWFYSSCKTPLLCNKTPPIQFLEKFGHEFTIRELIEFEKSEEGKYNSGPFCAEYALSIRDYIKKRTALELIRLWIED